MSYITGLNNSRGMSGSLESLTSMGADSVMSCGAEASNMINGFTGMNGLVHVAPRRKISTTTSHTSPQPRSPLESTSSLELSPRMEQVCLNIVIEIRILGEFHDFFLIC